MILMAVRCNSREDVRNVEAVGSSPMTSLALLI